MAGDYTEPMLFRGYISVSWDFRQSLAKLRTSCHPFSADGNLFGASLVIASANFERLFGKILFKKISTRTDLTVRDPGSHIYAN